MNQALARLQLEIVAWQQEQFRDQTVESKIKHLQREVKELLEKPSDIVEMADCLNLLLGIAGLQGISADRLVSAGEVKLEKCKLRKWGEPDAEGVYHHIEEAEDYAGPKRTRSVLP